MNLLENSRITLRALEPKDLDLLYEIENDGTFWEVSGTLLPFSKHLLRQYLENAHQDLFEAKQLRLVIERQMDKSMIGLIDLFDFEPQHMRAGIGIMILKKYQQQGFGAEALSIFMPYAFEHLNMHQVYANIPEDNKPSIHLFKKLNFSKVGTQKDWIQVAGKFKDVGLYQLINPDQL